MPLRYGENPHQQAALYMPVGPHARGIAQAEQVQGKELSYNNLNDANAALELVAEFRDGPPTVVIVKHANPCGVASARDAGRGVGGGARLRQRLGVRRDRRGQPSARRRDRRGDQPASSPKSSSRPMPTTTRARSSRAKKNLRLLLTGELARSGARRADADGDRRRLAGPDARQWPHHRRPCSRS